MSFVLASTSLRRYQILTLLNLPFLMVSPDPTEVGSDSRSPAQEALHQAHRKAASLVVRFPEAVVLGSDTLISLDGVKIGKPRDGADARAILRRLRGRTHEVITGVALLNEGGGGSFETVEIARVRMREFSSADLETYVATGDSLDKAGAYSIQGAGRRLVADLDGDYFTVVGLPLRAVVTGLRQMGVEVSIDLGRLYRERNFLNWRTFD